MLSDERKERELAAGWEPPRPGTGLGKPEVRRLARAIKVLLGACEPDLCSGITVTGEWFNHADLSAIVGELDAIGSDAPPTGMPAVDNLIRVQRGVVEQFRDCLMDADVLTKNACGELTFGDLRAAIHEWRSRPAAPPAAPLVWRSEPPDRPGWWLGWRDGWSSPASLCVDPAVGYPSGLTHWFGPIPEPTEEGRDGQS